MARLRSKTDLLTAAADSGDMFVGEAAPANPIVGQRWFRLSSSVVYQYTSDGATSFWLDISSDGIGTSASRSVDIVANSDPHLETNPAGGVGTVYYNREGNRYFVCTDATSNANVWSGRYVGSGGVETTYKSGSDFFKVHSFLKTGTHTFYLEAAQTIDYLVVGGGGGGGIGLANGNAAGGGAGGLLTATGYSLAAGNHVITVGAGGVYSNSANGGNSSIGAIFVARGGGHGGGYPASNYPPGSGNGTVGSGGGQGQGADGTSTVGVPTTGQGNAGSPYAGPGSYGAGGGGGAGGVGKEATLDTNRSRGGAGGEAVTNSLRTGSAVYYAGGGAGSTHDQYNNAGYGGNNSTVANRGGGGNGKHNQAAGPTRIAESGKANTGGGGGGGQGGSNAAAGDSGWGGSGIVVIRYQINP